MADVAYQALSTLSQQKIEALKIIPLDDEISSAILHDAKQAVHKFMPLLQGPYINTVQPSSAVSVKFGSSKLALRDFLSSKKGSVKTI
ncbi:hypothetical protein FSST1_010251 [Fusarium sambucinum]